MALALVALGVALSTDTEGSLTPAAEAVADLPRITAFSIDSDEQECVFDAERGGMVHEGLTVASKRTGVLELSFHLQRDSLDDVLPGYVSTVLVFDDDTSSHTFDLVVPVSEEKYEAGYDECVFSTTGE